MRPGHRAHDLQKSCPRHNGFWVTVTSLESAGFAFPVRKGWLKRVAVDPNDKSSVLDDHVLIGNDTCEGDVPHGIGFLRNCGLTTTNRGLVFASLRLVV